MDFPLVDLMDQDACYHALLGWLHPGGLACPRCGGADYRAHRHHRDPVTDYRCRGCGRVFNAFTGTVLQGTRRRPAQVVLILRGFVRGETTAGMAREQRAGRGHLLEFRHRLQENARRAGDETPLSDEHVEADEMYKNAGEKRDPARRGRRPAAAARR